MRGRLPVSDRSGGEGLCIFCEPAMTPRMMRLGRWLAIGTFLVASVVACKKEEKDKSATPPATGGGPAAKTDKTPVTGDPKAAPAADPKAAPADQATGGGGGANEFTSTIDGKTEGPVKADRAIYADDGHGNLFFYILAACPEAPAGCGVLKHSMLNRENLTKACPNWTGIYMPFNPAKDQKANMGPLKITPGKYGAKSEGFKVGFVDHMVGDSGGGGQLYSDDTWVEVTSFTDTQMVGSFEAKKQDGKMYKGSFTATKCTCDSNTGECK